VLTQYLCTRYTFDNEFGGRVTQRDADQTCFFVANAEKIAFVITLIESVITKQALS
jgi:hypothetical protein